MKEAITINAEAFRSAFIAAWEECSKKAGDNLYDWNGSSTLWTNFMKGDEGVLTRAAEILRARAGANFDLHREWYTIDLLLTEAFGDGYDAPTSPLKLHALIEHENGEDVETEMWKLIFWRTPLKVIIFYDWSDNSKKNSEKRQVWLNDKLKLLWGMRAKAHEFYPENSDTEYLVIVGRCDLSNNIIWGSATQGECELQAM